MIVPSKMLQRHKQLTQLQWVQHVCHGTLPCSCLGSKRVQEVHVGWPKMRPTQSPVHCAWVNYSYQWDPAKYLKDKTATFTLSDQPSEMCDFLFPLQVNMNVLVVLPPSAEVPLICSFSSIKGVFGHATVAQHGCMNVPTLPWMTHRHLTIHPSGLFLFP